MIRSASTALITGLFAFAALPAAAQDANLCGGIGGAGQWLGGDEAASDLSTAPSYVEQMALVLLRNEYVGLFNVSEAGDYRIEAMGRGGGDTVIDVTDAAGNFVISDDDSGGEGSSLAETYLNPGTYCVAMRSFDGTPLTGFVRAGRIDQEALTPGFGGGAPGQDGVQECDLSQAQALIFDEPVTQSFNQQQFYRLQLDSPQALSLTAENEDADPILTLFDGAANWLAENDDFDGLNSRIDMVDPLPVGEYCIALGLYGNEDAPITVTVKEYDADEAQRILYARGEAAPSLDGSYPVTALGEITTRLREDATVSSDAQWYSFDVYEGGLMLIEAISQGNGDPVLIMYDDLGRQVGYNDDGGEGLDPLLTVRIQPGTYLVAVKQLNADTTGLVRMVFERYVPARP
ncbi:ABC transporter substrate-binding protein [Pseudooctadecabacter sp.]|uniref:ABC transporter substrate-binding protein n=1 Tax=Pseudooctadecabacter sp. TaxID=1966338 RepID=UPI0035C79520